MPSRLAALDEKRSPAEGFGRSSHSLSPAIVVKLPSLDQFNRVVIKVGSSLLVDGALGAVRREWLEALASDIAALHERGASVIVVSSGAIALGRTIAGLPKGALKLEDSQASAAIGQIALASEWSRALAEHGIVAGQVLLTLQDTEERRRYLNARATLGRLFAMRSIPIINEKRYGGRRIGVDRLRQAVSARTRAVRARNSRRHALANRRERGDAVSDRSRFDRRWAASEGGDVHTLDTGWRRVTRRTSSCSIRSLGSGERSTTRIAMWWWCL